MINPALIWDPSMGGYVKNKMVDAFENLNTLQKGTLIYWLLNFMHWARSGQDPQRLERILNGYFDYLG